MSTPVPPAARRFGLAVIVAGSAAIVWAVHQLMSFPTSPWWLVLLGLTSFSSTFSIRIPHVTSTISVSETFVFLCALLYGPAPAILIVATDGLAMSFWRGYRKPFQIAFNAAQPALSLLAAAVVFSLLAGHHMGTAARGGHFELLPIAGFVVTYFVCTSGMTAGIIALSQRLPLLTIWRQHFGWVFLNYLGAASVASLLLIQNQREFDLSTIAIVLPLLVISYFTFKTSLQRVEDANKHLEDLNRLYLSTIETLAMAVDAKDQVTHGHIRRVQAYAIGLAKVIGVRDERELKAIEAAALLHDLGKLAIPEHILNKPGKLSNAEFDKMKKHASIGADILSAIDFPYPVVPIVRHHHERWDGRGYPDGISGADIPIGARILSVVDCFDALTSDRPYRRALTDEKALSMLMEDRGKAYDPIVVDAFARVYGELEPSVVDLGRHAETLKEIAAVSHAEPEAPPVAPMPVPSAADADSTPDPMMVPLLESMHAFSAQAVFTDAAEDLARVLQRSTPATLAAFYVTTPDGLELILGHAVGSDAACLRGMQFPKGEKLSGWVAATQRTVCNSDPSLDFVDLSPAPQGLQSCLSVPLLAGDSLVGVLSLYAPARTAFNDQHRRVVERSARPLAHLIRGVLDFERVQEVTAQSALAALPTVSMRADPEVCTVPTAVISFRVVTPNGAAVPDLVLARAAAALRRDLRVADFLYRDGPAGLLAVLPHVDRRGATTLAMRAHARVASSLASQAGDIGTCSVVTGVATSPGDGVDLDLVMQAARDRAAQSRPDEEADATRMRQPHLFDVNAGSWVDVA